MTVGCGLDLLNLTQQRLLLPPHMKHFPTAFMPPTHFTVSHYQPTGGSPVQVSRYHSLCRTALIGSSLGLAHMPKRPPGSMWSAPRHLQKALHPPLSHPTAIQQGVSSLADHPSTINTVVHDQYVSRATAAGSASNAGHRCCQSILPLREVLRPNSRLRLTQLEGPQDHPLQPLGIFREGVRWVLSGWFISW